jgi:hypothetical protein
MESEMERHVACMREMRNTHKTLIETPKYKMTLGTPMSRWEDYKKI